MFACFDAVIYEVLNYKTPRLKAQHQARSEARQTIREQRQQAKATPQGKNPPTNEARQLQTTRSRSPAPHRGDNRTTATGHSYHSTAN